MPYHGDSRTKCHIESWQSTVKNRHIDCHVFHSIKRSDELSQNSTWLSGHDVSGADGRKWGFAASAISIWSHNMWYPCLLKNYSSSSYYRRPFILIWDDVVVVIKFPYLLSHTGSAHVTVQVFGIFQVVFRQSDSYWFMDGMAVQPLVSRFLIAALSWYGLNCVTGCYFVPFWDVLWRRRASFSVAIRLFDR